MTSFLEAIREWCAYVKYAVESWLSSADEANCLSDYLFLSAKAVGWALFVMLGIVLFVALPCAICVVAVAMATVFMVLICMFWKVFIAVALGAAVAFSVPLLIIALRKYLVRRAVRTEVSCEKV